MPWLQHMGMPTQITADPSCCTSHSGPWTTLNHFWNHQRSAPLSLAPGLSCKESGLQSQPSRALQGTPRTFVELLELFKEGVLHLVHLALKAVGRHVRLRSRRDLLGVQQPPLAVRQRLACKKIGTYRMSDSINGTVWRSKQQASLRQKQHSRHIHNAALRENMNGMGLKKRGFRCLAVQWSGSQGAHALDCSSEDEEQQQNIRATSSKRTSVFPTSPCHWKEKVCRTSLCRKAVQKRQACNVPVTRSVVGLSILSRCCCRRTAESEKLRKEQHLLSCSSTSDNWDCGEPMR